MLYYEGFIENSKLGIADSLRCKIMSSKFRHPIYLFRGVAFLGLFIAWGKLIPLACFLLIYPLQILRARKKGEVLEQAFGEDYRR